MATGKSLHLVFIILFTSLLSLAQPSGYRMNRSEYIDRFKDEAIKEMHFYGIPASITLAQGILESGDGNSPLARYANNHFGIKCHKGWEGPYYIQDDDTKNECFRKYLDPEESYRDHSKFLKTRERYSFLFELKLTDYKAWAYGLKKAGYATNPSYPELLIKIIEENNLNEFDVVGPLPQSKPKTPQVTAVKKPTPIENTTVIEPKKSSAFLKIALNNNVKYVIARKGDTPETIARELIMKPWQIIKYNELDRNIAIKENDIIYIQPKRNKSETRFHVVASGEHLKVIAQKYGIKLKKLCAYNLLEPESIIRPGEKIYLQKVKK